MPLGGHEWAGGHVAPTGHSLLESFALVDGLPRRRWRVGDMVLERTLATRYGGPSVAVVHALLAGGPVRLEVEVLTTWRDVHSERHAYGSLRSRQVSGGAGTRGSGRDRAVRRTRAAPRRVGTRLGLGDPDGDAPDAGTGCPCQAWSVAEALRTRRLVH